jgi:hypothetical protein
MWTVLLSYQILQYWGKENFYFNIILSYNMTMDQNQSYGNSFFILRKEEIFKTKHEIEATFLSFL